MNDLVEALFEVAPAQTEQRPADDDVVASAELHVETDTELDERREHALDEHLAGVGAIDPGDRLQQRRLSGAVPADYPEALTFLDREVDVAKDGVRFVRRSPQRVEEMLSHGVSALVRDSERLRDPTHLDGRGLGYRVVAAHTRSGSHGSSCLNMYRPSPSMNAAPRSGSTRRGEKAAGAAITV